MKRTLLFLLFLFPLFCKAQIDDWYTTSDTAKIKFITSEQYYSTADTHVTIYNQQKPTINVFGKSSQLVASVDTAGNLKVYGDTLTVLKAIFRSFNIKINE